MRICYYADGRYVHAQRWMRYFAKRGHEMHLISFADVSASRATELEREGIIFHGSTGNFHIKKPWFTIRDIRFVKSVLRKAKIDVLHSHFLGPNIWYATLSGFHPHIVTVMGGDVIGDDWRPHSSIRERLLTPRALGEADVVTAWSNTLGRRVKPFVKSGKTVHVVHGGVDLERFTPGDPSHELRTELRLPKDAKVVFSSRLIRRLYNIDKLAAAANLVCAALPQAHFVLALPSTILDQNYVDSVKRIFSEGAAREKVRFVPTIGHDRIREYYRLADVSVSIPSTDGTPMTVLESMACGTATVIGNLPDYDAEYFEDGKTTVMVKVNDPCSIADGIFKLLEDSTFAESIAEEARRRVIATGGYDYQMSKMEEIYYKVVC